MMAHLMLQAVPVSTETAVVRVATRVIVTTRVKAWTSVPMMPDGLAGRWRGAVSQQVLTVWPAISLSGGAQRVVANR
jgi:hypothetical protein